MTYSEKHKHDDEENKLDNQFDMSESVEEDNTADEDDEQENRTKFGDWQIGCRTIDF